MKTNTFIVVVRAKSITRPHVTTNWNLALQLCMLSSFEQKVRCQSQVSSKSEMGTRALVVELAWNDPNVTFTCLPGGRF